MRTTVRRGLIVAAAVGLLGCLGLVGAMQARAADDYPYKNDSSFDVTTSGGNVDPWGFVVRNCTSFVAWRLNLQQGRPSAPWPFDNTLLGGSYANGTVFGNGNHWDDRSRQLGITVDQKPAVGAVAQWNSGQYGHVAIVSAVGNSGNTIDIEEYNHTYLVGGATCFDGLYYSRTGIARGSSLWPSNFLHIADSATAKYARHIVQQKGDKKKQKTSWYVSADLRRLWIPDIATFNALRSMGAPKPNVLKASDLDALRDQTGFWAAAGNAMTKQRTLRREMALRSASNKYTFTLRSDGNLALTGPGNAAIWDAKVSGIDYLVFQKDGNLVGYKDGVAAAVWATNTGKNARRFVVRNDGVAAVLDANGKRLWSTKPETGTRVWGVWVGTWYVDEKFDVHGPWGSPPYDACAMRLDIHPFDVGTGDFGDVTYPKDPSFCDGRIASVAQVGDMLSMSIVYPAEGPLVASYISAIVREDRMWGDYDDLVPPPGWINFRGPFSVTRVSQ